MGNTKQDSQLEMLTWIIKALHILLEDMNLSPPSDDADEYDDHTSVWGGAGPDCITGRLVTAQYQ